MRIDVRTRSAADGRLLDVGDFWRRELPEALGATGPLAARGAEVLGLTPLGFEVEGEAFTLAPENRTVSVTAGVDAAATVVRLDRQAFSELMLDRRSTMGLVIADLVEVVDGDLADFVEWEPALRAIVDGRPVYEPGSVALTDGDGRPLDLARSFSPDDHDRDLAAFLGAAGFLRLRGLFTAAEMARLSDEIDTALGRYAPDDGRSWWARTSGGEHRPVRLQEFERESEAMAAILADRRWLRLRELTEDPKVPSEITEALIKPVGVVEGISDVPWHKDCSLGGHSSMCCAMTIGISVTGSDETTGQLCAVAGSHRASVQAVGLHRTVDLPVVPLPTEPGDVTIHLSCTLHMSVPPTAGERRVIYTGWRLAPRPEDDGVDYHRVVRATREAAPARMGSADAKRRLGRAGERAFEH